MKDEKGRDKDHRTMRPDKQRITNAEFPMSNDEVRGEGRGDYRNMGRSGIELDKYKFLITIK